MFLNDLFEDDDDILSDLISSFKDVGNQTPRPAPKRIEDPGSQSTAYRPRKIKGVDHSGSFSQWIRSEKELRGLLNKYFGSPRLTLDNCIRLYTEHNYRIDDSMTLIFPIRQIDQYKEYDRDLVNDYTGKMTADEFEELKKDIQQTGIRDYGVLNVYRLGGAKYSAILGEGNHRLNIAKQLGIPVMPLKFYYGIT